MTRPRVLIADDHSLLLEAFEHLLEKEFEVVGTATDGRALVAMAQELEPDAIVADMTMPGLNGLDAARRILENLPETRIVLLTVHEDSMLAAEALRSGVSGYVVKRSAAGELQQALREALAGRTYLTPLVADGDSEVLLLENGEPSPIDRLTPWTAFVARATMRTGSNGSFRCSQSGRSRIASS